MNGPHPDSAVGGAPDYWRQISGLMEQQLRTQAETLKGEYKKQLDAEVAKVAEELKHDAAKRVRAVVLAAIGAIVAGFAILAYTETRSLAATSSGYYDAVMGLQKEVMATSSNLGEKVSLIAAANKELDLSVRKTESTRKDLQGLVESVTKTKAELDAAKQRLSATSAEYEARLKALRQAGSPKSP